MSEGDVSAPRLSGLELLGGTDDLVEASVEVEEIAKVPSWRLDPSEMYEIARRACAAAADPSVHGVVVTHGTSTMEYTAYLTDLYLTGSIPIVFTGAMREADHPSADGPHNLRNSIVVACDPATRSVGAVICFAGGIYAAREVQKVEREDVAAFAGGRIGTVLGSTVVLETEVDRPRSFSHPIETSVSLVKAFPGAGPELILSALEEGVLGLVVEGFPGSGGVPGGMQRGLRKAVDSGIPVVLSSRATHGRISSQPSGGTGAPLRDLQLISSGDLSAEKALVLLMAALGETRDREAIRETFRAVAG